MRIAICDDNAHDTRELAASCGRFARERELPLHCREYESGAALLADTQVLGYDIVLLDIYLPGENGIDVARALRTADFEGAIILVTASRDHYPEGFEVIAVHYLLKPYTHEDVCEGLERAVQFCGLERQEERIPINCERQTVAVMPSQIRYLEVYDHSVTVHTTHYNLKTGTALKHLEPHLNGNHFVRCHRSYYVNLQYVASLGDAAMVLDNGETVPVSRRSRAMVKQAWLDYAVNTLGKRPPGAPGKL